MSSNHFQKAYLISVAIGIGLIVLGKLITPKESLTGVIAAIAILIIYGLIVQFTAKNVNTNILSNAILFGLIASLIFATEIILEYITLPKDNTAYGLVEFGSVFFLYFWQVPSLLIRPGVFVMGFCRRLVRK